MDMINSIEADCRANCMKARIHSRASDMSGPIKHANEKAYLDQLLATILSKKKEIEKLSQTSSIRSVQDEINSAKKQLHDLTMEIHSLEKDADRQKKVLSSKKSSPILTELEEQVAVQRRLHTELRRSDTEVQRKLRSKQQECIRLEDTMNKSSRDSSRDPNKETNEIALFEEELSILTGQVKELRRLTESF